MADMPLAAANQLQTEMRNARTAGLDRLSGLELARTLHSENYNVAAAVAASLDELASAIELTAERLRAGGRLLYVGAGTSGRLGVLDASECPPTFGTEPELVQGIIAGGEPALRSAVEGAEDDADAGARDVAERGVGAQDVVVGIAASGRTPYVAGALRAAREAGAYSIAIVNVQPAELSRDADLTVPLVTGPEALTGSTRLKAGTAQKMALNLLSTGVMVRLGKTYGNLMVDMRASNAKLRGRAVRIVMTAVECTEEAARSALDRCGWHAKTAIVMVELGVSAEEARARLGRAGGFVRAALTGETGQGPGDGAAR